MRPPVDNNLMPKRVLNLGCGNNLIPDVVNVDIVDYGNNVVHNLNAIPYPFLDDEFDLILCHHILEHLQDFHATVGELYRIAKNGAHIHVLAPFFLNTKYFGDPDHRTPFSIRSFDNYEYISGRRLRFYEKWKHQHRTNYGATVRFKVLRKKFNMSNFWILRWFNLFANIEPVVYERFFASILSPEECEFELEVIKSASKDWPSDYILDNPSSANTTLAKRNRESKGIGKNRGKRSQITQTTQQFVKFAIVGLSGMIVALGVLNLFMAIWCNFPTANVVAFLIAVSWNFFLNRRFTFNPTGKPIIRQWIEFVLACLGGAVLNWMVSMGLYYSLSFFKEHFNYAAIAGVAVACTVNFLSSRIYVFRGGPIHKAGRPSTISSLNSQEKGCQV